MLQEQEPQCISYEGSKPHTLITEQALMEHHLPPSEKVVLWHDKHHLLKHSESSTGQGNQQKAQLTHSQRKTRSGEDFGKIQLFH